MALVLADRVRETTNTTGTGTLTLAGAVSGFQSFATIGNGNTTYYTITSGTDWEVGLGTYTAAGTTLARTTVYASSAGGTTKITVAAGANVFVTYPATQAVPAASAAITGGSIDGTTVGATTASTGAFTSISATSRTATGVLATSAGQTANVTITNTVTYTTGGKTLASQTAAANSTWRVRAYGTFTAANSATARNAQVACFWGATQLTAITSTVLTATAQTTNFEVEFDLTASSTTAIWTAGTMLNRTASATTLAINNATPASTAVTSGAQTLDLRFSMSVSVAGDSWVVQGVTIERLV
ncbi:hypothetical protein UFOVP254_40 [uncultured Caudovirales phage]|uniref:Uncharacterized protein n=1 Tax=uncultured Caudovirales phage TaxID=2100421 RepID=A0A6J5LIF1_9CAUD|nr:hypothetical protein UFOVP76_13 [uncultured Caudovirales phage]CAB4133073.1 hypothetical protein UFOVP254_40 [uncultured Caudovirales phage]